jgi:hypothetical protein
MGLQGNGFNCPRGLPPHTVLILMTPQSSGSTFLLIDFMLIDLLHSVKRREFAFRSLHALVLKSLLKGALSPRGYTLHTLPERSRGGEFSLLFGPSPYIIIL